MGSAAKKEEPTTVRTVKTAKGDFDYESDMPVRALKGLFAGASESDLDLIVSSLSLFVTAWPFGGDPGEVEAWEDLKRSEFNAVVRGVMEDLGSLGEE